MTSPLGSLGAHELQQLSQLLQLLRSGSPELKELLNKSNVMKAPKDPTPLASTSLGSSSAKAAKGRWRDGKGAQQRQAQEGWVRVKKKKDPREKTEDAKSGDELLQEGISVPVKTSFANMSTNDSGICLCSTSEAKRALAMMWGDKPAAVLAPMNIEGRGVERDVLVRDKEGRIQRRGRFVFQLGYGAVEFSSSAPKKQVATDSARMIISFHEDTVSAWKNALKDPAAATRQWLQKHVAARVLEMRPPTRTPGVAGLQTLVYIQNASSVAVLRASGADGVFTREFYVTDADRARYRVVPCKDADSIEAAREQASHMADDAFGVVRTRRGYGIRVLSERYEAVIMHLRPDDAQQFVGDRWEISGLPVTTGVEAMKEFVDGWEVHPLFTFRQGWRRTWVVRARSAPSTRVVEHQSGFAVIQEYQQRPPQVAAVRERWQPGKRASASYSASFPPLPLARNGQVDPHGPTRQAPTDSPAGSSPVRPAATMVETSLEERIASAVAAAMAPFAAQMAALQVGAATNPAAAPMETERLTEVMPDAVASTVDVNQDGVTVPLTRPAAPDRMNTGRHEEYSGPNS